jgi:hypothetical protein
MRQRRRWTVAASSTRARNLGRLRTRAGDVDDVVVDVDVIVCMPAPRVTVWTAPSA